MRQLLSLLIAGSLVSGCSQTTAQPQAEGTDHGGIAGGAPQAPKDPPRAADVALAAGASRASGG
ncbi:beta-xylosidase, partial [Amycolatopsis sp. NPDC000673]